MNRLTLFCTLLVFVFTCSCCDPEEEGNALFILDIKGMHDDQPFVLGQTYQNDQDSKFNLQVLRFYVSHLTLTNANGSEIEVKVVDFVDFVNHHDTYSDTGEVVQAYIPPGNYTSMRFVVGLDSILNFSDPSTYESTHPLSLYTGAYWTWNTGYIFTRIDGSIDLIPNGSGTLDKDFFYHMGTMPLYREIQFDGDFTVVPDERFSYKLRFDVDRLFYSPTDTLNAVEDNFTHTTDHFEVAERVTNLFVGAFSKR